MSNQSDNDGCGGWGCSGCLLSILLAMIILNFDRVLDAIAGKR